MTLGGSFSLGPRVGWPSILEIWREQGERGLPTAPSLCYTRGGGRRMSLVGIGNRLFCGGSLPRETPPPSRVPSQWTVLPLPPPAPTAPVSWLRALALDPVHRVSCEMFPRCSLDWQRLTTPGRPKGALYTLRPGPLSPPGLGEQLSFSPSFFPLFPSLRLRTKVEVKLWGWRWGEAGPPRTRFLHPQGVCLPTLPSPQQGSHLGLEQWHGLSTRQAHP